MSNSETTMVIMIRKLQRIFHLMHFLLASVKYSLLPHLPLYNSTSNLEVCNSRMKGESLKKAKLKLWKLLFIYLFHNHRNDRVHSACAHSLPATNQNGWWQNYSQSNNRIFCLLQNFNPPNIGHRPCHRPIQKSYRLLRYLKKEKRTLHSHLKKERTGFCNLSIVASCLFWFPNFFRNFFKELIQKALQKEQAMNLLNSCH